MDSQHNNDSSGARKLRFMDASSGSEEFTAFFRAGAVRYLTPLTTGFLGVYFITSYSLGSEISILAFLLAATCGISWGLASFGHEKLSLRFFLVTGLILMWILNFPTDGRPNGFATGGVYLYCIFPITYWMCFPGRRGRMAILSICVVALASIALRGQFDDATVKVPAAIILLGLAKTYFFIAVTMGMGHAFEISIKRFDNRWRAGFEEQRRMTAEIQTQNRKIEREVSAHQKTLADLSISENRYRKLFDNAFDGIVIFDEANARAIEINESFCQSLGYSQDEMHDLSIAEISPTYQADGTLTTKAILVLQESLLDNIDLNYSWRHMSRYGEEIDFEISTFRLPGENQIRVSILRDVTEQNKTKYALEEANQELRSFAHAASHDLKEPLRTMSNFARLIERRYSDVLDDSGKEYISYITDAASRGTALVTDLLRFAEVGTDQITTEIVSLNQVAATVKQTVNARLNEEDASLRIDDLPEVIATPTWSQQLLQNLISNALKFKREGVPPEVHVYAKAVDSSFEVYVKDNGIGIAEENLGSVFGVFKQLNVREKFEGNGIGLALCQRIMNKLGGSIRVESTFGVGTTFILSFPMLSPEPTKTAKRVNA